MGIVKRFELAHRHRNGANDVLSPTNKQNVTQETLRDRHLRLIPQTLVELYQTIDLDVKRPTDHDKATSEGREIQIKSYERIRQARDVDSC